MMVKGNKGFGASLTEGLDDEPEAIETAPAESVMASRSDTLSRLASGKVITDRTEFVDPKRCRPWRLHNRDLDHLNEESCRDLIDAFLSAKKQRIPAIVRRVRGDPDIDFEIIAGVRRWWTVNWLRENHHPEFDYLVTIQNLTDEEAFRVSDVENRARKDISDWERAKEYSRALEEFYGGSLSHMAEHLNISVSWLSRMIDLVRLPEDILIAFPDRHEITVRIARELKPLCKDIKTQQYRQMADEAKRIASEANGSNPKPSGAEVCKRLLKAAHEDASTSGSRQKPLQITSSKGKPMLTVSRPSRGNSVTVKIHDKSGAGKEEMLKALEELLPSSEVPNTARHFELLAGQARHFFVQTLLCHVAKSEGPTTIQLLGRPQITSVE